MDTWQQTRERLIEIDSNFNQLPEIFEWGIDLCGVDLRRANLRDANLRGVNLRGADLYKADLFRANLYKANLHKADLSGSNLNESYLSWANLSEANLFNANLRKADIHNANLSGSDLCRADLYGANLDRANLLQATINWTSHDLLFEILRRKTGTDIQKRKFAALVLTSRDWCWKEFLAMTDDPMLEWALKELAIYVKPGDSVPEELKRLAKL